MIAARSSSPPIGIGVAVGKAVSSDAVDAELLHAAMIMTEIVMKIPSIFFMSFPYRQWILITPVLLSSI
jgi:hypothetical protein